MTDSMFKTKGPLDLKRDRAVLIDRKELDDILSLARQPVMSCYGALLSARQTGKTTLLFQAFLRLRDQFGSAYVDLSVLRNQNESACYRYVGFHLLTELKRWLDPSSPVPDPAELNSSVDFLLFLRQMAESVRAPRIVIMLDEVGALSAEVSDSFFNTLRTLFNNARRMDNVLQKYLFVFCGAVDLYNLTFGTNSPLNICEKIYLSDFPLEDVQRLVMNFEKLGVSVHPEAINRIYELTQGHPYLTQRLCALMERRGVEVVSVSEVDSAVEDMLTDDDNLRHVIRQIMKSPEVARRLAEIVVEERHLTFTRNDPVLARLEMIGIIGPELVCKVRNPIYERVMRDYLEREETLLGRGLEEDEGIEMAYLRLELLRRRALSEGNGTYEKGLTWEQYAAALFAVVPAFSVYPDVHTDTEQIDVLLAIDPDRKGGQFWNRYAPAILVECKNLKESTPQKVVSEVLGKASLHNINLVFVMTTGGTSPQAQQQARYSASRGETLVVLLDDSELEQVVGARRDIDQYLREKVLDAWIRRS